MKRPTDNMKALLKVAASVSPNSGKARAFVREFIREQVTKALNTPIKKGIINGDIITGIFEPTVFDPGAAIEYPYDIMQPGTEKDHVAYVMPNHGYVPQRAVEGDYVTVPTYDVANSIDANLRYLEQARWDIVTRMMEIIEGGFRRKLNDDGWHTLLAAAVNRNIVVYDSDATSGFFTKRLVSLGKTSMKRNGGGNSTAVGLGQLTDLYTSVENLEDIRSWSLAEIDDTTRREIFVREDGSLSKIFGVILHEMFEFGNGQVYQNYYLNILAASLQAGDTELSIGLDLSKNDSFVMPIRKEIEIYDGSESLFRENRFGYFGRGSYGFSSLDGRRVLILSN